MLGSELWESKFDGLLSLVKEYIVDVWEVRNIYYTIVTQDLVILSLHLGIWLWLNGRGMVSSVRMVSLVRSLMCQSDKREGFMTPMSDIVLLCILV